MIEQVQGCPNGIFPVFIETKLILAGKIAVVNGVSFGKSLSVYFPQGCACCSLSSIIPFYKFNREFIDSFAIIDKCFNFGKGFCI